MFPGERGLAPINFATDGAGRQLEPQRTKIDVGLLEREGSITFSHSLSNLSFSELANIVAMHSEHMRSSWVVNSIAENMQQQLLTPIPVIVRLAPDITDEGQDRVNLSIYYSEEKSTGRNAFSLGETKFYTWYAL